MIRQVITWLLVVFGGAGLVTVIIIGLPLALGL